MSQYDKFADEYIKLRRDMFKRKTNAEFPIMLELMGDINNKQLLDLGCGVGDYAKIYSEKGAFVTAVDNSKKEIEHAKNLHISNIKFMIHDINYGLPFENSSFDIITSSLVFDHLEGLKPLFKECNRILKDNGQLIFSITNPIFYQERSLVGKTKILGRKIIFGDYFKRRMVVRKWYGKIKVEHYHKTLEDYFSAFLKNGFELVDFKEPAPINTKSDWHSKNPVLLVFNLKKKINER